MPRQKVDTDVNLSDALSKRRLQTCIATLAGPYEVALKPIDPKRSNQQNRYFWRVCCQTLAEWFTAQGQTMTKDQAKVIFCEDHLPVTFTNPVTGEVRVTPGSTSKLSIPEFAEFLEKCLADMAILGIEVEPPPVIQEKGKAKV